MKTKKKSLLLLTLLLLTMAVLMLSCKKDDENDDYDDIRDLPDGQVDVSCIIDNQNTTQAFWL